MQSLEKSRENIRLIQKHLRNLHLIQSSLLKVHIKIMSSSIHTVEYTISQIAIRIAIAHIVALIVITTSKIKMGEIVRIEHW